MVALFLLLLFPHVACSQKQSQIGASSFDKNYGIVHSQRLSSGVPLGGIGAGNFQCMSDGRFSQANFSSGVDFPTGDIPGGFAMVWTRSGDQKMAQILSLKSDYELPCVKKLDFDGLFPQANLSFPESGLPISVELKAFSPLIPHDLKNSCFPAAAFIFRLKNLSDQPVEASVALSWENILGIGNVEGRPFSKRTGGSVVTAPDSEGFFSMNMAIPSPIDPAKIESQSENSSGNLCLMTSPERAQAVVTSAGWNALEKRPGWWESFAEEGVVSGSVGLGVQGVVHPAGVIAVKITLKPKETVQIPFAVAWRMSHHYTNLRRDYGHFYDRLYPDSSSCAKALLSDWRSLLVLTAEWQNRLLYSDLPVWIVRRIINSASTLSSHSLYTGNGRFLMYDRAGGGERNDSSEASEYPSVFREKGVERASSALATQSLMLHLFPELGGLQLREWMSQKSLIEPEAIGESDLDLALSASNTLPLQPGVQSEIQGPPGELQSRKAIDNASIFLILMAQYVRETGDREFLLRYYSFVERAVASLLDSAKSEGFPAVPNLSPDSGSLFLAAMLAGEQLCRTESQFAVSGARIPKGTSPLGFALRRLKAYEDSLKLSENCKALAKAALPGFQKRFLRGREVGYSTRDSSGKVVFIPSSNGLLGEWAANLIGSKLTITSPDAPLSQPIKGVKADPPLKISTSIPPLPSADQSLSPNRDIPSYLISGGLHLISKDQEAEGLSAFWQLERLEAESLDSPWSSSLFQPLKGRTAALSQSATHSLSWNLLSALEGVSVDQVEEVLRLVPEIPGTWRTVQAPIFSPTFWGKIEYKPTAKGGITTFRLDRIIALPSESPSRQLSVKSILQLKAVVISGPPMRISGSSIQSPTPHVSLGRLPVGVTAQIQPDGSYFLTFGAPLAMSAGDRLEIDLH